MTVPGLFKASKRRGWQDCENCRREFDVCVVGYHGDKELLGWRCPYCRFDNRAGLVFQQAQIGGCDRAMRSDPYVATARSVATGRKR